MFEIIVVVWLALGFFAARRELNRVRDPSLSDFAIAGFLMLGGPGAFLIHGMIYRAD